MFGNGADTKLLADTCAIVRRLLALATRDEVRTRHEIGVVLCNVRKQREAYGERTIERIARTLEVSADTLYRCAAVADNWSVDQVEALIVRSNTRGEPLSWSHLVALTKAPSADTRERLVNQCLAKDWSVRQLGEAVEAERADANGSGRPFREDESVRVALAEGVQQAARASSQLTVFLEALDSRMTEEQTHERLVLQAIKAYEVLQEKVEATLSRLRRAESSGRRVAVAQRVREDDIESDPELDEDVGARRRATR